MPDHATQNENVLDQFAQQAPSYAALVAGNERKDTALTKLLEVWRPASDARVLDVGCGTGRLAVALAPHVGQVTGVDLTPAMLDQARALQARTGLRNLDWRQADVTALPFADAAFDLVTCSAMLHHVVSPAVVLGEMWRVCAPGGLIAAMDLTPSVEKSAAFDAMEILRDPSHAHALTQPELRGVGAALGLTEVVVHAYDARLPLEAVLATSFPEAGVLDRVRELYRLDAVSGADSLGFSARFIDGQIHLTYPMTLIAWRP
jgi:ubiquinone/menaquinone biosynthesis C-methylase UbiE